MPSITLHEVGRLAQATGDYGPARQLYQQSREIKEQLGSPIDWAQIIFMLGWLLWRDFNNAAEAIALWERVLPGARNIGAGKD